mmetsp:Transcript_6259/g.15577  ORF Transcript_6259/g.15577 Transcript_6259/m.15577 type:complete len:797 (+) Transcript_6259:113-2503(+)|eukprot:CAMPEP_0181081576 /NCGR_PEP_ID=MMETSP1071-20121207/3171_1 /TAXON_ID=35127 /ORGANISM="Thalassiosira sp., Strain NH16" /LENGTH=796 /DNA_ID=CAMNT_0023163123 /DNA_START=29 /DNA_END=2419 /DNA_ORIENTATION=+
MVAPFVAAAQGAAHVGSAGAAALGLGMGRADLELTQDLFKLQMRQAKRLWTADWAENSVRHGEQCLQSAQQHSESQAMATAAYFQAEKLASQGIKLARDQDCRAYEMAWRAEVRESLRDELTNQNNRFNIIMLCDTVCLSCVFSLVADGSPPEGTHQIMLNFYVFSLGLSITLFTISLWCAVIVVRRLHEHTASTLERKLFAQNEDLQKAWRHQLEKNLPTGPDVMHLVNQAYERWVAEYLSHIGDSSIQLLSIGVVAMFVTAGLLMHNQYLIEYDAAISVPMLFWSWVLVTSTFVLYMKMSEDRKEKKKLGVYDVSWQDCGSTETGPYAKISKAAEELFSRSAVRLGSAERVDLLGGREKAEWDLCAKTESLHRRVESLIQESDRRAEMRKAVLQLLTTATEELDALPEELTSRLNKVLHDIDEADGRTANLVSAQSENMLGLDGGSGHWDKSTPRPPSRLQPMSSYPIDAQRIPVSLGHLRMKLGAVPHTTLLRLRNLSDEPLRLKSGVQLKRGVYIKSLNSIDPHDNFVCYHLYPGTEIPPRTEVAVVARSGGGWVPTSGIEGEIVYTNRNGSWVFRIKFVNQLVGNLRRCQVQAMPAEEESSEKGYGTDEYWKISRDEIDRKANCEVVISIDVLRGQDAVKAASKERQSQVCIKSGLLLKNKTFGLRLQWRQKWFVLTPTELIWSENPASEKTNQIFIKDILSVKPGSDLVKKNVIEICTRTENNETCKLAAESPAECDDWIRKISSATGLNVVETEQDTNQLSKSTESSVGLNNTSIECIASDFGTQILPI